jgi:paraquat-inducible protein B
MFAELSESINLEKLSKQISELILVATQRLKDLDMKKVSSEFTTTSESLRSVLLALKESYVPLGKSLTGTSEQTQKTLLNLNKLAADLDLLFEPGSEFRFELDDTLRDVSGMAKSLKNLADLIERNPQAFIIGKPTAEE